MSKQKVATPKYFTFLRDDWAFHFFKERWTERLPKNQRLLIDGETYVHWYDCVTDYVLA